MSANRCEATFPGVGYCAASTASPPHEPSPTVVARVPFPAPFDWVGEAGKLRGELMALEVFLLAGAPRETALANVQRALRENMDRLNSHFDPIVANATPEG